MSAAGVSTPAVGPKLADIHLPPDPTWWPPAPGWWVLAALILLAIVLLLRAAVPRWRARSRAARALAEFEAIAARFHSDADAATLARDLSIYLRRVTQLRTPGAVALNGEAWLLHLDRALGTHEFSSGVGRVLLDAPYRRAYAFDAPALLALTRRWSRRTLVGTHA